MAENNERKFKLKDLPSLIVDTYKAWDKANPWRLSAVVAYYAVLSLPALLIIIINIVGSIWGTDIVQGRLTSEISTALGSNAAESIETIIAGTQNKEENLISTIVGIGTLLFGATGVFYQLKLSLNEIWQIKPNPDANFWKLVTDRARSFAFILVIGFLLLVSFIVTAGISALNEYIRRVLPDILIYIAYFLDFTVSVSIITVLFALMFRYMPDAKIRWKTVWIGALITAVLFVIGKSLLGFYFGEANPGSTYGAAGTIVLILLWVSYSCLILFFGAEFTYIYAKRYGHKITPSYFALDNNDTNSEQQSKP
ncbi:YihY/virulence factor BrkB family protein [Cellulophaga baltica]|jgi:membrane protein|uniref:Membrane protein n=2 Tax=Cellulophaga baltica TaxID=76594 RepID=A0A1G7DBZ9_9FLAO|nr:YihY/virulence factor BrkB family protein [Cellulophaga baltica]AIY12892.1 ribonuclease BN [Cellulophaga baltica NN016038]AIZ41260.1 ribonuclease BN [Cellulophaga baltica 18]WFO14764.1 YihY/virulence factor BrkB family protein [Cellulophaga baltica 4]SDE49134.1 membrane protein [Cellulophaga baltica]